MSLYDLHVWVAWFVVVGNGLAGAWCLAANWVEALRVRALWWSVVVVEVALFVQAALGVGMVAGQGIEAPQMHMFYGFTALIAVGLVYSYRQQMAAHRYLLYGGAGFFLMGMGIRSMLLG